MSVDHTASHALLQVIKCLLSNLAAAWHIGKGVEYACGDHTRSNFLTTSFDVSQNIKYIFFQVVGIRGSLL